MGRTISTVDETFEITWGPSTYDEVVPAGFGQIMIAIGTSFTVPARQTIITPGSTDDDVYLIRSGSVRFSLLSVKGRETVLRKLGPHHMFGELAAIDRQVRSIHVTSIGRTMLTRVSAKQFRAILAEHPAAALWCMQSLTRRVRDLTDRTLELATLSVNCRVQQALLSLCRKASEESESITITGFPTHETLAAQLGTHREAITRELGYLKREGIISQSGRRLRVESVAKLDALLQRGLR